MFALTRAIAGSARIAVVGKPFAAVKAVDAIAFNSARTLATAATPKKKTAAASATTTKKAATASKTSAAKKTTTTAAKGKKTTAATGAKKAPAKKTAAGTKKAPAKKAAAAPKRTKKVLTPEEEAKIKLKKNFQELKERALDPPKSRTASSGWLAFVKAKLDANPGTGVEAIIKDVAAEWKQMSPEQRVPYDHSAETAIAKENLQKELTAWVNKHTPNQIYQANLARAQLRRIRKLEKPPMGAKSSTWRPIPDARLPLGARGSIIFYAMEKLKDLPAGEKVAQLATIMKSFSALPEAEKKKYADMAKKDYERYNHEMNTLGIQRQVKADKKAEAAA